MFNRKKIKLLEAEIEKLKAHQDLLDWEMSNKIKDKFSEISGAFDKLIVNEADDIRKEWKEFKKQNKKLFKPTQNK